MLEKYIFKGAQKLRCGYTTGSCAAAASKAAAEMLLTGRIPQFTEIMTPKGIPLKLEINNPVIAKEYASCAVVKDSGDDPDITNGIYVYARVSLTDKDVTIIGGEGIGTVTKSGLDQPVGASAINSVPRKMIASAVGEAAAASGYTGGFHVVISVPDGKKIAEKTYNPRMGIEGGISIIGTSGIVEPMSSSALIETIRTEAKIRRAEGQKNMLLTLGNYSEAFVKERLELPLEKSVTCSNFIGEAIEIAQELGFESILIAGHMGKLVKLGAGIMNTHSAFADGRMDVLVTCGLLAGADMETLRKIPECVTVDAALDILAEAGYIDKALDVLAERIDYHLCKKVKNEIKTGAIAFSFKHDIILKTKNADALIAAVTEEWND